MGAAIAGLEVGYIAGNLEKIQEDVFSPWVSYEVTKALRFGGFLEDDNQAARFQTCFEKIIKIVLSVLIVCGALVAAT